MVEPAPRSLRPSLRKRYTSNEITTDAHLLGACRYVVLNPLRAGLCRHPMDGRWSSCRASAGLNRGRQDGRKRGSDAGSHGPHNRVGSAHGRAAHAPEERHAPGDEDEHPDEPDLDAELRVVRLARLDRNVEPDGDRPGVSEAV